MEDSLRSAALTGSKEPPMPKGNIQWEGTVTKAQFDFASNSWFASTTIATVLCSKIWGGKRGRVAMSLAHVTLQHKQNSLLVKEMWITTTVQLEDDAPEILICMFLLVLQESHTFTNGYFFLFLLFSCNCWWFSLRHRLLRNFNHFKNNNIA